MHCEFDIRKVIFAVFFHTLFADDVVAMYVNVWNKNVVFFHKNQNFHTRFITKKTVIKQNMVKLNYRQKKLRIFYVATAFIPTSQKLPRIVNKQSNAKQKGKEIFLAFFILVILQYPF